MNDTRQSRTQVAVVNHASAPNLLLPAVLWSHIFCFLGSVPDLIHCEQTCRDLYQIIHNNDDAIFWKHCPGATDDYDARYHQQSMSHRQRACIHYVSDDLIRKEQKKTDNIIESCLGIPLWLAVIHSALNRTLLNFITCRVRGDASFVLMEMIQESLIERVRQAYGTMVRLQNCSQESREYPIFTADALVAREDPDPFQPDTLHSDGYNLYETFLQSIMAPSTTPNTNLLLPTPQGKEMAARIMSEFPQLTMSRVETMIRRITLRAGVVKLSQDFYRLAWESALQTILVILVSACNRTFLLQELRGGMNRDSLPRGALLPVLAPSADGQLTRGARRSVQQKMPLRPCESICDVPPFPYFPWRPKRALLATPQQGHIIVPRQLEEAALNLPMVPKRVYGAGWHVSSSHGSTLEKEIMLAEAMYTFEEGEQETGEDDTWDSEGSDGLAKAAHYLDIVEDDDEEESDDSDDSDIAEDDEEDARVDDELDSSEDAEGSDDDDDDDDDLNSDVDDENTESRNDNDGLDSDGDDDDDENLESSNNDDDLDSGVDDDDENTESSNNDDGDLDSNVSDKNAESNSDVAVDSDVDDERTGNGDE
jgi:hypothetical protein